MNERFIEIKKKATKALDALEKHLARAFEILPAYEVAVSQLEHKPTCSKTTSLIKTEHEDFINMHDGGAWGLNTHAMPIKRMYVECTECHAVKGYLG